ncbi:hypothetical protein C4D60_Mb08t31390 [Musa balbisiana]|uniref:Tetratricopeptide repeat protein 5 OB fold domain-containing protein n=1 Tax=Musa balbisiana TaxID=52838 RepID=A0A4V4H9C7_MUSBA|nr:hypothetical protein C4D60_Mb08t31390 [Musa balbisiana]
MSGSGSDEAESIARASAAAEELYRLRDTYFPRDPEEKTSKLRTLADTALALLDSLPLEMVNLATVCGGQASSVASPRPSAELRVDSREAPVELEAGQPRKKVKTCVQKKSDASAAQPEGGVIVRVGDRRRDLGWGEASPSREGVAKAPREPSIRDLCRIPAGAQGEPYQARAMGELPEGQPSDPLVARWAGLTRGDRVWADGDLAASFIRGGLHPEVARDLYTLPSEVLLGKSAKSLLWRKSPLQRANYEYLRGKMLDIFPDYIKEAEDHLSKAVKLNPSLADAWLCLGNCIWKKGDLPSAKNCFSLALSKGPNKKILCQLSMLERSAENKAASIEESIKHAREAVLLDIKDGNSWYNLGNACLTSFFVTGAWDHAKLQQSLKAYQNAEKDELMHSNPDLYFNCASANKYLENYERALHGFEAAASKDPGLNADDEAQKITSLLDKIESSLRGLSRSKRLASLVSSLGEVILKSSHGKATVNVLKEGLNKAVAIIGKVLLFIKHESVAPLYYLICDSDQTCFVLSVYGLHSDAIKEGDRVILMEPHYRVIDFSWKGKHYHFQSIRVDFVEQVLVNEKVPAPHHLVRACIHAQHKA